jgi:15-cis-phytoene synthase
MVAPHTPVSPLITLAASYGDAEMQSWCHALFGFDAQLASIVLAAREPMLAQIRLQWWHDVIGKPAQQRPLANPVLAGLTAPEAGGLDLAKALAPAIRGWDAALDLEEDGALESFAAGRGHVVQAFHALTPEASLTDLAFIGASWATWDMARCHRPSDALLSALGDIDVKRLASIRLPRRLRPLSIIARAVQLDIARGQMDRPWGRPGLFGALVWHGITGR